MIGILLALAAQTLTTSAPLADKDGDGRVTLRKAIAPFKRDDTLTLCAGQPRYTYAIVCPAVEPTLRGPQGLLADKRVKAVWDNSYPAQPVNGAVIAGVRAVCSQSCIVIGRASTSTTVRDVDLSRDEPSGPAKIDTGIKIGGSKGGVATAGVLIERVRSHHWLQNTAKGRYANGDGMFINRGVLDVTVRDSEFDDNADSGVDSKAGDLRLFNVSAARNGHYGYRFWGGVRATTLTSIDNAWGHVEAEAGARVVIDKLIAAGPGELVTTNGAAVVEIKACDLSRWTGTVAVKRTGKPLGAVTLGASCRP